MSESFGNGPANKMPSPERKDGQKAYILERNGERKLYDKEEFKKRFGVDNWVRIPKGEFKYFDPTKEFIDHFNLKETNSEVGKNYIIIKIEEDGKRATESQEEIPPLLSLDGAFIAECIEVQNNIPYEELAERYFEHSVGPIRDPESLKAVIQERYKDSREGTPEEKEKMGVAHTLFRVVKRPEEVAMIP